VLSVCIQLKSNVIIRIRSMHYIIVWYWFNEEFNHFKLQFNNRSRRWRVNPCHIRFDIESTLSTWSIFHGWSPHVWKQVNAVHINEHRPYIDGWHERQDHIVDESLISRMSQMKWHTIYQPISGYVEADDYYYPYRFLFVNRTITRTCPYSIHV
jgi:hypothetical protein